MVGRVVNLIFGSRRCCRRLSTLIAVNLESAHLASTVDTRLSWSSGRIRECGNVHVFFVFGNNHAQPERGVSNVTVGQGVDGAVFLPMVHFLIIGRIGCNRAKRPIVL